MKCKIALVAILMLGGIASAQNCGIIPTPQQVNRTSEVCIGPLNSWIWNANELSSKELKKAQKSGTPMVYAFRVEQIAGAENQREAYRLEISPRKINLYATCNEGEEMAMRTLKKLAHRWNDTIPCMTITDWPAYEYRGWMDDISRGPVVRDDYRQFQAQRLSEELNMNFGTYYTEHTFFNPAYPDIAPLQCKESDWKKEGHHKSMQMLNLQCFAHFEKTLRIPFYQNMMDTRYNVNPAEEATYQFLKTQIDSLVKSNPKAKFFNINCDETEGLGSGHAAKYVDSVGAVDAYCQHINKVYELIKPHKKEVLMWGDIIGKNPEMLDKLPTDMQYIVWSYVPSESFVDMLKPFKEARERHGNQFWVAPGVSHWSAVYPAVNSYIYNIANFARDGYQAGARGLLNTAWDDSGESLFNDCWHAMAWAAEMAWKPIENTDPELARKEVAERLKTFNENYDKLYGEKSEVVMALGNLQEKKCIGDWYNTSALMAPLMDFYPSNVDKAMIKRCKKAEIELNNLPKMDASMPHEQYAVNRIRVAIEKNLLRVKMYEVMQNPTEDNVAEYKEMASKYMVNLHALKLEYLRLWDMENGDYSRNIICDRYDYLGYEVLEADRTVMIALNDEGKVELKTIFGDRPIYYTLDGRKPSKSALIYNGPFKIDHSCIVKAVSYNEWNEPIYTERYMLSHKGMGRISKLNSEYSKYNATYSAGGDNAMADGMIGDENSYRDGHWQGYQGTDIDVEYNFGKVESINTLQFRFLQNTYDWILAPQKIKVYSSKNGKDWKVVREENYNPDFRRSGLILHDLAIRDLKLKSQYLRIVVENPGPLPQWHPAKGGESYLFIDEIVIN